MLTVGRIRTTVRPAGIRHRGGTMRIRQGVMAAGIVLASAGVPLATAGAAYAAPTQFVDGVITGPHTFTWVSGPIFVGEVLLPNAPFYSSKVPVTGISV